MPSGFIFGLVKPWPVGSHELLVLMFSSKNLVDKVCGEEYDFI